MSDLRRRGTDEHRLEHELMESGQPEVVHDVPEPAELLATPREGIGHPAARPKDVVVIGAGLAGLVAAFELKRRGHRPILLEAQNRVGGRVYTLRSFAPGLYAEAGAMRIPRAHDLTIGYCELFGLEMRPFVMGNPRGLVHVGGVRMTAQEAGERPEQLPFALSDTERGRSATELWDEAIAELRSMVEADAPAAWEQIVRDYDRYSLYDFLRLRGLSEGAIEYYAVMNFLESDLHTAFVEVLREELGRAYVDMQEIVGGMDRLPDGFFAELRADVRLGAEVYALDQDPGSVTVHYKTEAGRFTARGDYAICTLPFSVLRTVDAVKPFSRGKQRAIRQLNYHASTKILFQVRRRIWEEADGIQGGATVTDLPIRRMNYPTPDPSTERGILLASYTWGQDALQWGAMDPETRLEEALDDVSRIHPGIREVFEVGASHAWYGDRWARGAFALFAPEQQTTLQAGITAPEGRIFFAGEHCSLYHAWIQGALESGIRAAREIHSLP
ncbi:MAG: flavin monoamine oxidase family protein [Chloroflexi bacterium]|nr:flavin monoamine oxidase family protein [Chloroflexota bacterium]